MQAVAYSNDCVVCLAKGYLLLRAITKRGIYLFSSKSHTDLENVSRVKLCQAAGRAPCLLMSEVGGVWNSVVTAWLGFGFLEPAHSYSLHPTTLVILSYHIKM